MFYFFEEPSFRGNQRAMSTGQRKDKWTIAITYHGRIDFSDYRFHEFVNEYICRSVDMYNGLLMDSAGIIW